MISRRTFLTLLGTSLLSHRLPAIATAGEPAEFSGEAVFNRIVQKAIEGNWCKLNIGELIGKIAHEWKDTPYQSGTLELSLDREICSANLTALDCVTFFETTLDLARMLKKGGRTPEALLAEIAFTRYRGGHVGDYTSRLHYTSDWFYDNQKKHVVRLLTELPGSETFHPHVGFMADHPQSYPQLARHPALVAKLKVQEAEINKRSMTFVPIAKIADAEAHLKTGDIVGICTNIAGLDITHTGLIVCDAVGARRFMNASSKKGVMKVEINSNDLTTALSASPHNIGAMFARPVFDT